MHVSRKHILTFFYSFLFFENFSIFCPKNWYFQNFHHDVTILHIWTWWLWPVHVCVNMIFILQVCNPCLHYWFIWLQPESPFIKMSNCAVDRLRRTHKAKYFTVTPTCTNHRVSLEKKLSKAGVRIFLYTICWSHLNYKLCLQSAQLIILFKHSYFIRLM